MQKPTDFDEISRIFRHLDKFHQCLLLPSTFWHPVHPPSTPFHRKMLAKLAKTAHTLFVSSWLAASLFLSYDFYKVLKGAPTVHNFLRGLMLAFNTSFYLLNYELFYAKRSKALFLVADYIARMRTSPGAFLQPGKWPKRRFYAVFGLVYALCLVELMVLLTVEISLSKPAKTNALFGGLMFSLCIQAVYALKLVACLLFCEHFFKILNRTVLEMGRLKEVEQLAALGMVRREHGRLVEFVKTASAVFSFAGFALMFYYQCAILFYCYIVMNAIHGLTMGFFIANCTTKIVLFAYLSHSCQHQAFNVMKRAISKMVSSRDCKIQKELNSFALQLLHENFSIKAGFYEYGGPFLFTYFAEIFTRAILLTRSGEHKTKPTQNSVRELRGLGLSPDIICCRSEHPIDQSVKDKISNFCHVSPTEIISIPDLGSTYEVPVFMETHGIAKFLIKRLDMAVEQLPPMRRYMRPWIDLSERIENQLYGNKEQIEERHRHRYEVNPKFIEELESSGLIFVGEDRDQERMEIFELPAHPYYVGVQFHPEYLSRPMQPSPPFMGLILAAKDKLNSFLARGCKLSPREPQSDYYESDEDTERFWLGR